ncbi:MAG: hypothetical protein IKV60_00230 [Rikenellaceae bacterium]|nr:hypothetical protein [Rikenellaceae bacterium]
MKRFLRIFFVGILAISLTSCLTTLLLESLVDSVAGGQNNKEYDFEINTFCEYIIVNNSSRDVRVYYTLKSTPVSDPNYNSIYCPIVPQGGRRIIHTYKSVGQKSDDISATMKANPYALLDLEGRKIVIYEYDPAKTTYQEQLQWWASGDDKQLSPFKPSNWTLTVHKDLTTLDNGTWVGMYDCSYTYYITDEALQE